MIRWTERSQHLTAESSSSQRGIEIGDQIGPTQIACSRCGGDVDLDRICTADGQGKVGVTPKLAAYRYGKTTDKQDARRLPRREAELRDDRIRIVRPSVKLVGSLSADKIVVAL